MGTKWEQDCLGVFLQHSDGRYTLTEEEILRRAEEERERYIISRRGRGGRLAPRAQHIMSVSTDGQDTTHEQRKSMLSHSGESKTL